MTALRNNRLCHMFCLLAGFALLIAVGSGCDEYSYGYGSYDGYGGTTYGGGWYDYGFTEYYPDGSTNTFNINPGTDIGAELDNYLSDSWTTTY